MYVYLCRKKKYIKYDNRTEMKAHGLDDKIYAAYYNYIIITNIKFEKMLSVLQISMNLYKTFRCNCCCYGYPSYL